MPGDKSISHRAAIFAALADGGHSRLTNFLTSADCLSTLSCLQQLGIGVERLGTTIEIEGTGTHFPRAPIAPLDCGNSGTTMRLLAGLLAGQSFNSTLTGDKSLRTRPMRRIIEPLELMGATLTANDGCAPLDIAGRNPLTPINYVLPVASAQVKSAVLLAGLNAAGRTRVVEQPGATRDHTERLLRWFGVEVEIGTIEHEGTRAPVVSINGGAQPSARDCAIPGDISSAAFFIAAAALLPASDLKINAVGLNPTRAQIIETLGALGADVSIENLRTECNEEVGDVRVRAARQLSPASAGANILRGSLIAGLIDELPVLAVLGTQVEGGLEIRDARELRVKETDRIAATVANLRAMGAEVEEYEDGLRVTGGTRLSGARLESFGDHRIAMAFTVAALIAEGESEIIGADCVRISFPEFFDALASVIER